MCHYVKGGRGGRRTRKLSKEGKDNEEKQRDTCTGLTAIITGFLIFTTAVGFGPTSTGAAKKY